MAKIKDDDQKYVHSHSQVYEDGTSIDVYASPGDQRTVIRHSSGSHLEFKADGSIFVTAVKDFHFSSGANTSEGGALNKSSEGSTIEFDADTVIKCNGNLTFACKNLDIEAEENIKQYSGRETKQTSNTHVVSCQEQLSLEPAKSLYVNTKEMRESVVSRTTQSGTKEGPGGAAPTGGVDTIEVFGNAIIKNTDPKGGITIQSAGYLNLVCGAERVDVTGHPAAVSPTFVPSSLAKATYTHIVSVNPGPVPRGIPGSAWFQVGPGGYTQTIAGPTIRTQTGVSTHTFVGPFTETYTANKIKNVAALETATIGGIYKVTAKMIFLN